MKLNTENKQLTNTKICRYYNSVRIEYLRKTDEIFLIPCCTVFPRLHIRPYYWDSDYFIQNINKCLEEYSNLDLRKLNKLYSGICQYSTYNDDPNQICSNYTGNHSLVRIENSIAKACNLHCIMCGARDEYCKRESYLYNEVFKRLDSKYTIVTTCHGEPFLYKQELFDYVLPKFKNIAMLTNGSLLTDTDISRLSEYQYKTKISMSFDSDIKEIYEKIRIGASFDIVYQNMLKLKKANLLEQVFLVIQNLNQSTCLDTMKRLKELGIITRFIIRDGDPDNLRNFSDEEKQIIFETQYF